MNAVEASSGASINRTMQHSWKSLTRILAEGAGATGAEDLEFAGFTQQGHFAAHEASHFDVADLDCDAKTLPDRTTRLIVRTTSHRAARIIVVFVRFIFARAYFFFFSPASIFFTYLAGSLLKSSRQPLQHNFTSRPW